jgi:pyrroline-5-carboxylate reductase
VVDLAKDPFGLVFVVDLAKDTVKYLLQYPLHDERGDPRMGRIGFCGAGQMATALAAGFVASGITDGKSISAYDPSPIAGEAFLKAVPGTHLLVSPDQLAEADTIFLAVKPQFLDAACVPLQACLTSDHLVVSIVTGVSLENLRGMLLGCRFVRVMPNTPCMVNVGACGMASGSTATAEDTQYVQTLLNAVGISYVVPEHLLDAVTGLSGSGPAYIYQVIEALSDGGVMMGLPRAVSTALAAQTVRGAAEMVLQTGLHPGELKDRVASPGGTTIAAIEALENHGLRAALMGAVRASTERSQELGGG